MNKIDQLLASLSPEERALLEQKLVGEAAEERRSPDTSQGETAPLSLAQESLWLFNQLGINRAAYNVTEAFRLRGRLQIEPLRKAFQKIVERHEVLRTNFVLFDHAARQVVRPLQEFCLRITDLSAFPEEQREREIARQLDDEARREFDLGNDLMLRVSLWRLAEEEFVLQISVHHIVSDDWSFEILHKELALLYESFCVGKPSPLPGRLEFQYSDFARLQRRASSVEMDQRLAWWKEQLAGEIPALELPADRPRPAHRTFHSMQETFAFRSLPASALQEAGRRAKATAHAMALGAFEVLLQRYSAQDEFVIGCPIGTRSQIECESLIGFFVNTVPLRCNLSGNPAFPDVIKKVNRKMWDAVSNQEISIEQLFHELKLARQPGRNPFFDVVFQYAALPVRHPDLPGLSVTPLRVQTHGSQFDLALTVHGGNEVLSCEIDYSAELFDAATIHRFLSHYETLLGAVIKNPDRKIADLPLLTDSEKHQLVSEWNGAATDSAPLILVTQRIEEQAAQFPGRIAVRCADASVTYAELNQRANRLARYLQKHGAAPDRALAICFHRSVEMIVAILAVLKSGAAYVPIEPDYPEERLAFVLAEVRAPIVLTHSSLAKKFLSHPGKLICCDRDSASIAKESPENLPESASPENLAYIILTSGSTGQPKGVPVSHANLAHSTNARLEVYPERGKPFLLVFSYIFDGSVAVIFGALTSGGALTIPEEGTHQDAAELAKLIERDKITDVVILPSFYNLLLDVARPEALASIETVAMGGESFPVELIKKHKARVPGAKLVNEYGPTEGTVWCTVEQVYPGGEDKVTIGKPIPGSRVYILDARRNLVPIGVPGEICIGGPGVVRGYLNRPELTLEKFVADPFSDNPEARLYRTGDLASFLPNGKIDFLGRLDHQVKIRGYRIELGEIENVLRAHPSVRDAVAVVREIAGEKSLVAYVAGQDCDAAAREELRIYLQGKLPRYMLPSAIVLLEKLPLNAGGKVNRNALPAPEKAARSAQFTPPRNPLEEQVAAIWAELLKADTLSVHDNFFELGGHSLLATQIVSRVRSLNCGEMTLRQFFSAPTIAGMAAFLEKGRSRPVLPTITPLARAANPEPARRESSLAAKS